MASGYGIRGGQGRCFGFFEDLKLCAETMQGMTDVIAKTSKGKECSQRREDYFECLHGGKENERINKVVEEKKRQMAEAKNSK